MRKLLIFFSIAIIILISACSQDKPDTQKKLNNQEKSDNFILVKGGNFTNAKSNYYKKNIEISDFYISKYEITQKEWIEVMKSNPSDFKDKNLTVEMAINSSDFKGSNFPVETVSWYNSIEYCNKRSIKEDLKPYYNIDKDKKDPDNDNENDNMKWTVTVNKNADGYRLPTEKEWEYAAYGGQMSKNYTYSGSNDINQVAWYWKNSGDEILSGFWNFPAIENNNNKAKSVGSKQPNELGLYDMSGNIREWCWDWYVNPDDDQGAKRVLKGGGWLGDDFCCVSSFNDGWAANSKGNDTGLRVCRNK